MLKHSTIDDLALITPSDIAEHLNENLLADQVLTERMRQYMSRQRLAAASGFLPSAYLVYTHWARVSHETLLGWFVVLLFLDFLSVLHTHRYLSQPRAVTEMNTWRIRQIINQSLAGVVWGSVIYLFLDDVPGITDRAIVLTAVSSIAVIGFLPFHSAVIGFTVGLWSIPLPVLVFFGTTHQHQMAAGILVLVVSLNFYFWEASKQLVAGIEKNFQAEALARALRSAALRIQELAARDELTGLYNRRRGMQVFKQLLQRHNNKLPDEPGLGLLLIDIDHFKHVNDTHGHPAGDEVLRQVSRRLEHSLRQTDTVARIGGEEFMVLLPDTVADNVTRIAQELCTHVAATAVYIGDTQLQITISIGAVEVACDEVLEHALARADAGLYSAKRGGRNRVVHAAAALTQAAH